VSNVPVSKLTPGVFGLSHGGGLAGDLIRHATESSYGHAFLYLGDGVIVQGQPQVAALAKADSHSDATWAWRMWDQLAAEHKWTPAQVKVVQDAVVLRGRALVGTPYDWAAYAAFASEVLHLAHGGAMQQFFEHNPRRVCSGLVADALTAGQIPLEFIPEDGAPGLVTAGPKGTVVNLVAPGMLAGLGMRKDWF
jgi:hypothetical protein